MTVPVEIDFAPFDAVSKLTAPRSDEGGDDTDDEDREDADEDHDDDADQRARDEAGADWLSDQGFDRKD